VGRSIALLLVVALLLAAATFIEKYIGTVAAKTIIYYSPLLIILFAALVVNFIAIAIKQHLLRARKWVFLCIHGALMVILAGALVSHIFGEEGSIYLREGAQTHAMLVRTNRGDSYHKLPFDIKLKEFVVTRYPDSFTPSSYKSIVVIHLEERSIEHSISVNKPLSIKGYRLFQSSYDRDGKGTVLSVNKDIPGSQITYAGYFLLIFGLILFLTSKNSRIKTLFRNLKEIDGRSV